MSKTDSKPSYKTLLQHLPSVDSLLKAHQDGNLLSHLSRSRFLILAKDAVSSVREEILQGKLSPSLEETDETRLRGLLRDSVCELIRQGHTSQKLGRLQHVINATGVVIHTNLGRAPLSERARRAIIDETSRYCNLEYDLVTGKRGRRGGRAIDLLSSVTGAEDALIVNNCAAATMLVLSSLASDGETIVSRGELVEIGGDFRVPDVMERSGTILKEVGTTNRTQLSDYADAVNEKTRVILSVHSSNFKIIGYTAKPTLSELVDLCGENGLILYEDAGSGAISEVNEFLPDTEPRILESIANGVDIVSFSGDKLMGGIQSGIIVGKRELIEKIRRNPLYRALRVDKLVYSCIEATLESYADGLEFTELPVLKMLSEQKDALRVRTERFLSTHFGETSTNFEIVDEASVIGGGTTPGESMPSVCIAIKPDHLSANRVEEKLRLGAVPVIARISDDRVLIDLRTVFSDEEQSLAESIKSALSETLS